MRHRLGAACGGSALHGDLIAAGGRHRQAAQMTRQIIATAYSPDARALGDQPASFEHAAHPRVGRSRAGRDRRGGSGRGGSAGIGAYRVPILVPAGKLDQSLAAQSPDSGFAPEFRAVHGRDRGPVRPVRTIGAAGHQLPPDGNHAFPVPGMTRWPDGGQAGIPDRRHRGDVESGRNP